MRTVFRVWVLVFGLVGAQMGWVLRPFIGDPSKPATFFREREGNFFQAVTTKIGEVMGISERTVETQLARANKVLRRELAEWVE